MLEEIHFNYFNHNKEITEDDYNNMFDKRIKKMKEHVPHISNMNDWMLYFSDLIKFLEQHGEFVTMDQLISGYEPKNKFEVKQKYKYPYGTYYVFSIKKNL